MNAVDDGNGDHLSPEQRAQLEYSIMWYADRLVEAVERYVQIEALFDELHPDEVDVDRAVRLILDTAD